VQVVEDGLSYLTRAMKKGVPGAAEVLCCWYGERLDLNDLNSFDDADLELEDCYEATDEFPRVHLPLDADDCGMYVLEAAAKAIEQRGMTGLLYPIALVFALQQERNPITNGTRKELCGEIIDEFEAALLKRAQQAVDVEMAQYAVMRLVDGCGESAVKVSVEILEKGAEQSLPDAMGWLGTILMNGIDPLVKADQERGFALLSRAASSGVAHAKYGLAICYRDGTGTAVDKDRYLSLMKESAEAKFPMALVDCGRVLVETAERENVRCGCDMIRMAAEEFDLVSAWELMLEYHDKGIGPFKTNKFSRAARAALKKRNSNVSVLDRLQS